MRERILLNDGWDFTKQGQTQKVNLPHCFNAVDGQEGADYYRGRCEYTRTLPKTEGTTYIEVGAANSVAEVFVNSEKAGEHRGGYSMFRFDITDYLKEDSNTVKITVDNSDFEDIYPSMADFTFYGGIYRDVYLITGLPECRFTLDWGRCGIAAIPQKEGEDWKVKISVRTDGNTDGVSARYTLLDGKGETVAEETCPANEKNISIAVKNPRLWNGIKDPYLYTLKARLIKNDKIIDEVCTEIGFRTVEFDSEKGCFLNGEYIKLKGVSRHQDRYHMGNALTAKEHEEDVSLILEVGANSVRLAHYQQDDYFYSLCDRAGLLVWAEVPVISRFSEKKQANAKSQLRELIEQNINHTSIFCWGVENEITIGGKGAGFEEAVKELHLLAKSLDPSRPTAAAQVMMYPFNGPLNAVTDILGYNIYYGWYMRTAEEINGWLDRFHEENPQIKLCLSEYGAEGIIKYQNRKGVQGDYSETYQAYFHEVYARAIEKTDWLWGSYVWNMFDFGAANRDEGGVKARNNKGLVTIDRKTKKDSFYVYKAFWSQEPFVQIGGSRYINRPAGKTDIVVYSNLPKISLTVNGQTFEKDCDRVVRFEDVEIQKGENTVIARGKENESSMIIEGVEQADPSYVLPEGSFSMVRNWFVDENDNTPCFSLNDRVGALLKSEEISSLLNSGMAQEVLGKKRYIPLLLKLIGPFKIKTLLKIAPIDEGMKEAAVSFITTVKK